MALPKKKKRLKKIYFQDTLIPLIFIFISLSVRIRYNFRYRNSLIIDINNLYYVCSGLSAQLAELFVSSCPRLERLRDVASWCGSDAAWRAVAATAAAAGLHTGWAEKTRRVALYTIDYDAEGWVQLDTGHKFELYNNLNVDWEVVENEAEMQALGRPRETAFGCVQQLFLLV